MDTTHPMAKARNKMEKYRLFMFLSSPFVVVRLRLCVKLIPGYSRIFDFVEIPKCKSDKWM
jgi:hypothetical protein